MPITFLHHPVAYFIYLFNKRLNLPGLIVGCMLPDLEIPFIFLFLGSDVPNRMILHSLLGSVIVGTFIGVIITNRIYPIVLTKLFNIDKNQIQIKCKLSLILVFSVAIGALSHVLLDVLNHPYNPVFWPFQSAVETPNSVFFAMGELLGSLWLQIIMGIILIVLIIIKRKNLFEALLVG